MLQKQLIATRYVLEMDQYAEGLPSLPQLGSPTEVLNQTGWSGINILNLLNSMERNPVLEITEQPKPKDHRFRYPCEGRTAGALLGIKSTARKKTSPEVRISNLACRAKIIGSLVFKDEDKPHPYKLVGRNCENGIVVQIIEPNNPKVRFESMGIQCVKRKELKSSLQTRKSLNVDPFNNIDEVLEDDLQDLECKAVRICFQAFLEDPNHPDTFTTVLQPVLTDKIFNKKDTSLKITRMNRHFGLAKGNEELFIFCEKVDKDDIQVEFYEESQTGVIWRGYGVFGSENVHHQVAIVLKTPSYKDVNINTGIEVKISLRRPSDEDMSEPMNFTYIPVEDAEGFANKRKRKFDGADYLTIKDDPGCSDGSSSSKASRHEHVRRRLKNTIKNRAIKKEPETPSTPQQPEQASQFSFPSVSNPNTTINVRAGTTTGHVSVREGALQDSSLHLPPDLLASCGYGRPAPMEQFDLPPAAASQEGEMVNLEDIPITTLSGPLGDGTNLSADQLASIWTSMQEQYPEGQPSAGSDPLLSQVNLFDSEQALPGMSTFLQSIAPQAGESSLAAMEISYPELEDVSD